MDWDIVNPLVAFANLSEFMETGGWVLNYIMGATFVMWMIIIERYMYYWGAHGSIVRRVEKEWKARSDHNSWYAHRIRDALVSEVQLNVDAR